VKLYEHNAIVNLSVLILLQYQYGGYERVILFTIQCGVVKSCMVIGLWKVCIFCWLHSSGKYMIRTWQLCKTFSLNRNFIWDVYMITYYEYTSSFVWNIM